MTPSGPYSRGTFNYAARNVCAGPSARVVTQGPAPQGRDGLITPAKPEEGEYCGISRIPTIPMVQGGEIPLTPIQSYREQQREEAYRRAALALEQEREHWAALPVAPAVPQPRFYALRNPQLGWKESNAFPVF